MNLPLRIGYEGIAQLARGLASIAPSTSNKLLNTFAARRGVRARFAAFHRAPGRPLLWMHAPSVGEGLQARLGKQGAPVPDCVLGDSRVPVHMHDSSLAIPVPLQLLPNHTQDSHLSLKMA